MSSGTRLYVFLLPCENFVLNLSNEMHPVPVLAVLVQAPCLHSVLGLVRPHNFRDILHQDVPRFPCISPTTRSTIQRVEPRASRSGGGGGGRYSSYGQTQIDHGSHALLGRVAALEQSQSADLAALQQELRVLRAQIATAAQTAFDIQVELGSKLVRLSDRVVALEKQAQAASSSSSSHRH
ncbi:hypothetical protein L917_21489 [Phytophthora nicotianae]|uniref:Uncharacterized protein n=1 Tax=Phytophthora nicotianae TaxID=4792 RepID=W2JZ29_PHYNI|nr:hypothetical protein L917_21489 [Phytophthora nicotianae]